jgi:hypothetical protein
MSVCHKIRPHMIPKLLIKAGINEKGLNCVRCDHSNRAGDRNLIPMPEHIQTAVFAEPLCGLSLLR